MKRSEVLLKLQRYYSIKHVMVEQRYITPDEFMENILQLVEELGMLPPDVCFKSDGSYDCKKNAAHFYMDKDLNYWEPE